MLQRGVPTDCARIYRLPTKDLELREKWLALSQAHGSKCAPKKERHEPTDNMEEHIQLRQLARNLLESSGREQGPPKAGDHDYPIVPSEDDLIGFVTTGNYNLDEGLPTAVANLALHRVMRAGCEGQGIPKEEHMCIVRQAGSTIGRLATWEVV